MFICIFVCEVFGILTSKIMKTKEIFIDIAVLLS